MSSSKKIRSLTIGAMIAALYTVLTLMMSAFSFGAVQVRVSEALTILAIYSPLGAWSVTFGCFFSNLIGYMAGINMLGFLDIFLGTFATGLAALLSYQLRHVRWGGLPILSTLPPVIINAIVVGAELTYLETNSLSLNKIFLFFASSVGIGQVISCVLLGLGLFLALRRTGLDKKYLLPHETLG